MYATSRDSTIRNAYNQTFYLPPADPCSLLSRKQRRAAAMTPCHLSVDVARTRLHIVIGDALAEERTAVGIFSAVLVLYML